MVKGITRQVILVKSPDPKLFEEAIFIVKEEALAREGVSADQVIREARQAADGYLRRSRAWNARGRQLPGPAWGAAGAVLASLAWGWVCFCCNRPEAHAYNGMWTGRRRTRLPGLPVQG